MHLVLLTLLLMAPIQDSVSYDRVETLEGRVDSLQNEVVKQRVGEERLRAILAEQRMDYIIIIAIMFASFGLIGVVTLAIYESKAKRYVDEKLENMDRRFNIIEDNYLDIRESSLLFTASSYRNRALTLKEKGSVQHLVDALYSVVRAADIITRDEHLRHENINLIRDDISKAVEYADKIDASNNNIDNYDKNKINEMIKDMYLRVPDGVQRKLIYVHDKVEEF